MKIKASVKLILTWNYGCEKLYYKIKYKIDNQKLSHRIKKCMLSSWMEDAEDYLKELCFYTRKEDIIMKAEYLIEEDIVKRTKNIKYTDKHNEIEKDIKSLNKNKIKFDFEIK